MKSAAAAAILLAVSSLSAPAFAQTYVEGFEGATTPALPTGWTAAGPNVWQTSNANPAGGAQHLALIAITDFNRSTVTSPVLTSDGSAASLSFQRSLPGVEQGCDGLRLFVSVNGGPFVDAPAAGGVFSVGGYDETLACSYPDASFTGPAWSTPTGYTTSTYDMPALAAGDTVQFQLQFLMDGSISSGPISVDDFSATGLSVAPVIAPVPTMTEWAMILFGLILAGGAAMMIQRRRVAV